MKTKNFIRLAVLAAIFWLVGFTTLVVLVFNVERTTKTLVTPAVVNYKLNPKH